MFGVNEHGKDVLAGQFKRTEGSSEWGNRDFERTAGIDIAVQSNMNWLRKSGWLEQRKTNLRAMKEIGFFASNVDIDAQAEEDLQDQAILIAKRSQAEMAEMASQAAILRTGS